MSRKFQLNQMVRLTKSNFSGRRPSADGLYKITRLMPADIAGTYHYRLQSEAGERVAAEGEILDEPGEAAAS